MGLGLDGTHGVYDVVASDFLHVAPCDWIILEAMLHQILVDMLEVPAKGKLIKDEPPIFY